MGTLMKQCQCFILVNTLQFSLPPSYTMLKLGKKKVWIHLSNVACGLGGVVRHV